MSFDDVLKHGKKYHHKPAICDRCFSTIDKYMNYERSYVCLKCVQQLKDIQLWLAKFSEPSDIDQELPADIDQELPGFATTFMESSVTQKQPITRDLWKWVSNGEKSEKKQLNNKK